MRAVARNIRGEAFEMSRRKAQAIRVLEMSAIAPDDSARSNLIEALTGALLNVVEGRWYNLPEAEYQRIRSRWFAAAAIAGAILAIGGAAALVALASKIGSATALLAPLLVGVAIGLLNMAGLPLNLIERYAQAGQKITPRQ
jgi:hypothetical protein